MQNALSGTPQIKSEKDYRLAFSMIPGLNITTGHKLLEKVGDERAFFEQSTSTLQALTQTTGKYLSNDSRIKFLQDAEAESKFIGNKHIDCLYFTDEDRYPRRLAECTDAPVMLYRTGICNLDAAHIVAIVGTRHCTAYGMDVARHLVKQLSEQLDDLVIVSGLAYGIDVAAHRAALEFDVPTVAVTAHPLNTIYPADHRDTARTIIKKGGALVTEYATCMAVHRGNFLARNRIIAGLSDVTVVVESDIRGGAMATARMASDYARDVFAVPGRLSDKYSSGTNHLINNQTAALITGADDIIDTMRWHRKPKEGDQPSLFEQITPEKQQVLDLLRNHPDYNVNDICVRLSKSYSEMADLLFQMEMDDIIIALPGGRYSCAVK